MPEHVELYSERALLTLRMCESRNSVGAWGIWESAFISNAGLKQNRAEQFGW